MSDTAPPEAPKKTTLTVTIDGVAMEADPGELLIAAAERTGTYIPRFCWHPRMREVGMCRMCLVNVSGPRGMSLQPACMQPCAEGMEVDTKSAGVKKAQDGILEFLLVNHPLDCPICDKGGECPLQDQTLAFGPGESRFVEEKRHFEKPIPISDLVLLDRERCILCDRCTRFSKEVAGDPLIHFINRGNNTEVNTFPDDPFASYFSGNVVQICPVGALTAQPYRFTARPWDLDQVESTCTSCSVGCRVVLQSSGDVITRTQGVDSDAVNWGWLCDKGRFDFEAVSSPARLTHPQIRSAKGSALAKASWADALDTVATRLRTYDPAQIGFIGGAHLTNEDQYAFAKLAKSVIGTDNTDAQLGDGLDPCVWLGLTPATIDDAANASAVLLIAPDLKEELAILFLRLRDASANRRVPIVELATRATGMSKYATSVTYRPGEIVAVVKALLGAADGTAPVERQIAGVEGEALNAAAQALAAGLASGRGNGKLVVVLGRDSLADSGEAVAVAAGVIAEGVPGAAFLPAHRRGNLRGAIDMGLAPGLLPGRVTSEAGAGWFAPTWGAVPTAKGLDTAGMFAAAADGTLKALVLLGADPLTDFPDQRLVEAAFAKLEFVVAIETLANASTAHADVVLPAAGYAEKTGTTTNIEGRVSQVVAKVSAPGLARPDWMIASELAFIFGSDLGFEQVSDITEEIARVAPSHLGLTLEVLRARSNADGVVVPLPEVVTEQADAVAPEASVPATTDAPADADSPVGTVTDVPSLVRFVATTASAVSPTPDSYSLRLITGRRMYDDGTVTQASPSLAKLATDGGVHLNPGEVERHGLHNGSSVTVTSQSNDIVMTVVADPSVPRGVAFVPYGFGDVGARALIDLATISAEGITKVRLETLKGGDPQ